MNPLEAQKLLLKNGYAILCDVVPKDIIDDLFRAYNEYDSLSLLEAPPMIGKAWEPDSLDWFFPIPLQLLHGLEIFSPSPLHSGQVCWIVKNPWLDLT